MLTLDEARENIGAGVVYQPHSGRREDGEITGVSDRYVFVRYVGDRNAKATAPEQLSFSVVKP